MVTRTVLSSVGNGVQRYHPAGSVNDLPTAPEYKINLDLPPEERWKEVAKAYGEKLSGFIKDLMDPELSVRGLEILTIMGAALLHAMPQPYRDEMAGFAKYSNVAVGTIVAWNLLTEIGSYTLNNPAQHFNGRRIGCTSIVAENSEGKIVHGRNMDLEWGTDKMREITLNVHFQSKNKTVYSGTIFAGLVGIWNGQKPNQFTVTVNERDRGSWMDNAEQAAKPGSKIVPFMVRDMLADANSTFTTAVETFTTAPLIAPCYLIVGGTQSGEGVVITRNQTKAIDVAKLDTKQGQWYVLKTNYDSWETPPATDDRRTPATKAMNESEADTFSLDTIFKVLSTPPVLAKDTIYTTLMSASEPDLFKTLLRDE